jgi:hypothetical protein
MGGKDSTRFFETLTREERGKRHWKFELIGTEKENSLLLHLPQQLALLEFGRELGCGSSMQSSRADLLPWKELQY